MGGQTSDSTAVLSGVPQLGTVLGPLLFFMLYHCPIATQWLYASCLDCMLPGVEVTAGLGWL